MLLKIDGDDLNKFILIGDRVLIKPKSATERTKGGLYLPPGVEEKRKIQSGYVIKAGPGYPIPAPIDSDEPWKESRDNLKYFPLQVCEGDLAVYLQDSAFEIEFDKQKYNIVPHSAILMLVREEDTSLAP
ncbi:MAG: co-chaperone GroES [Bacteroidetes bacterium]|nr:MAG: co-chaperone GroES [Bacteroidota bacterium]